MSANPPTQRPPRSELAQLAQQAELRPFAQVGEGVPSCATFRKLAQLGIPSVTSANTCVFPCCASCASCDQGSSRARDGIGGRA